MHSIRVSTPQEEGALQVSKWLKVPVLLDPLEMEALLESIGPCFFAVVSDPVTMEEALFSKEAFLTQYRGYVDVLKRGEIPQDSIYRRAFSCALTQRLETLYAMRVSPDKFLIKPVLPIIQLQAHGFFYSTLDGKFHSMVYGKESITWGIQFSYPQLCQDPKTHAIYKIDASEHFPNTAVFKLLMQWMRSHTLAVPFSIEGKRVNAPIRMGKNVLSWIECHVQLRTKGMQCALKS
ncbi:MAG: hypothetical protein JSS61_06440 [Verrucomicrobia bacterium]|nr:hypothetical protein [Verrucomicrobiota bacterium]